MKTQYPQKRESNHNKVIPNLKKIVVWRDMICSHCSQIFNSSNRVASVVCRRGHNFCQECLKILLREEGIYCPECFRVVTEQNVVVNQSINEQCQNIDQIKREIANNKAQKQRLTTLNSQILSSIIYIKNNLHQKIKNTQLQYLAHPLSNINSQMTSISNYQSNLLNKQSNLLKDNRQQFSQLNQYRRFLRTQFFSRTKNSSNIVNNKKYKSTANSWRKTMSSIGKSY